jgi:hypothetical protein
VFYFFCKSHSCVVGQSVNTLLTMDHFDLLRCPACLTENFLWKAARDGIYCAYWLLALGILPHALQQPPQQPPIVHFNNSGADGAESEATTEKKGEGGEEGTIEVKEGAG